MCSCPTGSSIGLTVRQREKVVTYASCAFAVRVLLAAASWGSIPQVRRMIPIGYLADMNEVAMKQKDPAIWII